MYKYLIDWLILTFFDHSPEEVAHRRSEWRREFPPTRRLVQCDASERRVLEVLQPLPFLTSQVVAPLFPVVFCAQRPPFHRQNRRLSAILDLGARRMPHSMPLNLNYELNWNFFLIKSQTQIYCSQFAPARGTWPHNLSGCHFSAFSRYASLICSADAVRCTPNKL